MAWATSADSWSLLGRGLTSSLTSFCELFSDSTEGASVCEGAWLGARATGSVHSTAGRDTGPVQTARNVRIRETCSGLSWLLLSVWPFI